MYEAHFGLKKRPFRALATGSDVFVGPQTATTMSGLKKALAAPDSIVVVTGPVGVGKTTQVRRALEAVGKKQVIVSVGRMQLGHDEVLELLLEEMGATLPAGTVQRFTSFRRLLKEHAEQDARVIIVVEDAVRIGADALAELEALTACDAGVSDGANIVLMGDQELQQVLNKPQLARLKQRLRLRHKISPFNNHELTGYLKHCFRLAGKEYDTLFAGGTADVLHSLSDGIARMANNLVESALSAAVDSEVDQVTVGLIKRVAADEYGWDEDRLAAIGEDRSGERRVSDRRVAERRNDGGQIESPAAGAPRSEDQDAKPAEAPPIAAPAAAETADSAADMQTGSGAANQDDDVEIPELIQDTLPDLAILAPALAAEAAVEEAAPDESGQKPRSNTELESNIAAGLEAAQVPMPDDEVPEWERDPTLAELRPDLDALEYAMAVAQGLVPAGDAEDAAKNGDEEPDEPVPEITLDREIQAKIEEAAEILKQAEEETEAKAEEERQGADDRPVSEILAEATKKTDVDKTSIESQLDATDAFAISKIAAVAAAEEAAEKATEARETGEAELPILQAAEPPVVKPPVPERSEPPVIEQPKPVVQPATATVAEAPASKIEAAAAPEAIEAKAAAPAELPKKDDPRMQKIASDLARARTLDDVDDQMAETLFGEEFSLIAAEVAANAPPELADNDELELALEESASLLVAELNAAAAPAAEPEPAPAPAGRPQPEPQSMPKTVLTGGSPDLAATQERLATVRALNAGKKPQEAPVIDHVVMTEEPVDPLPPAENQPETIEEQINTSITQTLEALSVRPPPTRHDDEDDDEDTKGGFFSRFRRS